MTASRPLLALSALLLVACSSPNEAAQPQAESAFDAPALWQTVRADFSLFYAYLDRRGFDGTDYLDRVEAYVLDAPDEETFRRRLQRATYAFTDPHLTFGPLSDEELNIFPTSSDLVLLQEGDRFRIADVRAESSAYREGLRPGSIVTHVEDVPLMEAARAVYSGLVDAPNREQLSYAATLIANGRRTGERSLSILGPDLSTRTVTLDNPRDQAREVLDRPAIETRWVERPEGASVAVLRINNRLGDNDLIESFDAALTDVMAADGLVIDLRNTPSGGNTEVGRSILGHFTTERQPFQRHEKPSLEREFSVPRHWVEHVSPRAPQFGPYRTVVLGGHWTGSMGEGLVIGFDALGVETIASDMGDLLGNMSNFTFADGRIQLSIPTETLFHVDGTPREDFVADQPLTLSDTDEDGNDPALRAALEWLSAR